MHIRFDKSVTIKLSLELQYIIHTFGVTNNSIKTLFKKKL